jgi:nucleoside-diphosphate-sugar epimerase
MTLESSQKKTGILLGGSGLIGGAITHYFKTLQDLNYELLAPNSKKLSLRVPEDIKQYLQRLKPDFIINTAIAALDSDPLLSFETNYLGTINLAKAAIALNIPYIHFSSAATMPSGVNLKEGNQLSLTADLTNYTKSKLMTELSLKHMWETMGLDCTIIRLGVVYGKHDHKIQGFHRLFFSIADQAMPVMLTKPDVAHSYTHTKKLPPFVQYILNHREEFSGQTYNFVDPEPVLLSEIILTIKAYLQLSTPREIYVPYHLSKLARTGLCWLMRKLSGIGIEARMPAEMQFLDNFYQTQTLSADKLTKSSYGLRDRDITVFSRLPVLLEYYLTRWVHLNLVSLRDYDFFDPKNRADDFQYNPGKLLKNIHQNMSEFVSEYDEFR